MSPHQALALQLGMFVAVVSGQVMLARRARPITAVIVGVLAILAMVGVAFATPRWGALNGRSAADGGAGTSTVRHPTPQERLSLARTLRACSIPELAVEQDPAWRWQRVTPVAAQLPMPAEMREVPDEVPDDPGIQQWELGRWGNVVLELDDDARKSSGFVIGGGAAAANESQCALRIGSSLVPVTRSAFVVRRRGAAGSDSMFTATTDIPFALPDTQLGVGISAHSRAGRDTLLSILAAIRFVGR